MIRFGEFDLIAPERVLRKNSEDCALGARAFDVLVALVERRDRVVSKSELLDVAWGGLIVEENNLSIQISALRRLLGQHAISTVPGRGYRFTLPCAGDADVTARNSLGENRLTRRLVAVLAAQVLVYDPDVRSKGEELASTWRTVRTEILEPQLAAAGGQVIVIAPEKSVATFASAIDALNMALDSQRRLALHRERTGLNQLHMRFAVLVDDTVLSEQMPSGETLKRLSEMLAVAGPNDVVSDVTSRSLSSRDSSLRFDHLESSRGGVSAGANSLLRVTLAVEASVPLREQPRYASRYQPRVAVLPFACEGGDSERYFGDGISEEIITHLALNRLFFVIARGSTLRYRERSQSTTEIASELGVRYLLDGSVRRFGSRLRISAEFTDCQLGRVIWADRFEGQQEDLFDLQARIASKIASAIDPCVREAELTQVRLRPTENLDAYDSVLRGLHLQYIDGGKTFDEAGQCFKQAVTLDPQYAQAHSHLAWWLTMCIGEGRSPLSQEHRRLAVQHACRAIEIDPRDAWALSIAGHTFSFLQKQFSVALDMFKQALSINPNCAIAWARSATTLAYIGRGEEAMERVKNALELSPFDQFAFSFCTTHGIASMTCGKFDEAVWWLEKARRLNPRYRAAERLLIAAHSQCGNQEQARAMATDFLRIEPEFRVSTFSSWYPLQSPHRERLLSALIDAGLPA